MCVWIKNVAPMHARNLSCCALNHQFWGPPQFLDEPIVVDIIVHLPWKILPWYAPKGFALYNIKLLHDIELISHRSHMIPLYLVFWSSHSIVFPYLSPSDPFGLRNTGWPRQRHDPPCGPPAVWLPRTAWRLNPGRSSEIEEQHVGSPKRREKS